MWEIVWRFDMCGQREEVCNCESLLVIKRHAGSLDTVNVGGGLIKYLEYISNVLEEVG